MGLLGRLVAYITGTSDLAPDEVQDWLDDAADMGDARLDLYLTFDRYYDGDHQGQLPGPTLDVFQSFDTQARRSG